MKRSFAPVLSIIALALIGTAGNAQPAGGGYSLDHLVDAAILPAPASTGTASPIESATLRLALEAARGRKLDLARERQASLSDPVARKIVDWALLDIFGTQLGVDEMGRLSGAFAGWPREDKLNGALEAGGFSSNGDGVAALPDAPIPYDQLGAAATRARSGPSFSQRRLRMNDALKVGDAQTAYRAISEHELAPGGVEYAESESYAGWLALNKLRDPVAADRHFARLEAAVKSPVSKARAAYWRGRAADAMGDVARAQGFYAQGAQYTTTFYGQLAAERAGVTELVLTPDPVPTGYERAAFEANEVVQAMRLLSAAQEKSLVRVFALQLGDTAASTGELALLVDAVQALGEQETSLLAYRRGAQKGLILHERGYPILAPPEVASGAETPLVLAIVRQESQFDPSVRSGADARGMMQLLPGTARDMARKMDMLWEPARLWEADYNLRLGSRYMGQLMSQFDGSYMMAVAGYNAGPGRPRQWVAFCGDPRSPSTDPLDFLECIPFSETRDYVMNAMANMQIYRARLAGGRAALTPSAALTQGGYGAVTAQVGDGVS